MERIAIVTDSTPDLPPGIACQYGIHIIPLSVVFEGKKYIDDGKSIKLGDFYRKLKSLMSLTVTALLVTGESFPGLAVSYLEIIKDQVKIQYRARPQLMAAAETVTAGAFCCLYDETIP